jgi:hypothetical protein
MRLSDYIHLLLTKAGTKTCKVVFLNHRTRWINDLVDVHDVNHILPIDEGDWNQDVIEDTMADTG